MARKKKTSEPEFPLTPVHVTKTDAERIDELNGIVQNLVDRIAKLELKLDAVEKRNAQIRFSGEDIFRKGANPFENRLR